MNLTQAIQVMLPPFALCVLLVGMLSYLGIHVIKREIIFVDLALAQIAALGALIGFLLGIALHTQASYWFSMALTAIAAAVFTLTRTRETRVPQEAVIGLVYAIAAAAAIILIDKAPHGAQHIKDLLTGSILWVQWTTVGLVAAVYAAVGLFHLLFCRQFLLISEDADSARAQGLNVRLWDFLFYLSFGFVITVSVGSAGVLLVFVFLVAPAVMAVLVTDRLPAQILFGWIVGVVVTVAGLTVSLLADLSSGPLVIAAYAVALIVVSAIVHVIRARDRARALKRTLAVAAAFAACFALLVLIGRAVGARSSGHAHGHDHHQVDLAAAPDRRGETEGDHDRAPHPIPPGDQGQSNFTAQFDAERDPSIRADIVCDVLRADPEIGAALALRYLASDPPLFFAQTIVDELDAILPQPSGLDVEQPFTAPVNQQAAQRVRAEFNLR
ncbi:MAG: metal ABC transporter permease [Armatimonadota bacterium]|nr:MAG: metal ABC transporter permease [Armatimonadota bacterium]